MHQGVLDNLRLEHPRSASARRNLLLIVTIGWGLLIASALSVLWSYASTPGQAGQVPVSWPEDSAISRDSKRFMLVLGLHPRCPCSQATVAELARVLTWCESPPAVKVLFLAPSETGNDFANTSLIRKAATLEGVSIIPDRDGIEAARFGITTSGHAILFDPSGERLFSGGITSARGHHGDSAGSKALISLFTGKQPTTQSTPVFGCSLLDKSDETGDLTPWGATTLE